MEEAKEKNLLYNYELTKRTRTRSKLKFNAGKGGHVMDEQPYWKRKKFDPFQRSSSEHPCSTQQVRCHMSVSLLCDVTYSMYSESAWSC